MLLSLCIPTNGVVEWVIPVLTSIYSQSINDSLFEVVIADNGKSNELESNIMQNFSNHDNLRYCRTKAQGFENQLLAFSMASGEFIKFINHRMLLKPGTIEYLLKYVNDNLKGKPLTYFSNGKLCSHVKEYHSFDLFFKDLSYWSSWSAGVSVWKKDYDLFVKDQENRANKLFPHIIFIAQNIKDKYVIDDSELMEEIKVDYSNRSQYNLFFAFAVEYPLIIIDLYRNNKISFSTYKSVIKSIRYYCAKLYVDFIVLKKRCSFELDRYDESIRVFFSKEVFYVDCLKVLIEKGKKFVVRRFKGI